MQSMHMVPVISTPDLFEARVIAARLGAEGIVWELRGGVDGPYPVGRVDVLVEVAELDTARELLRAGDDEWGVEDEAEVQTPRELWVVLIAMTLIVLFTFGRMLHYAH